MTSTPTTRPATPAPRPGGPTRPRRAAAGADGPVEPPPGRRRARAHGTGGRAVPASAAGPAGPADNDLVIDDPAGLAATVPALLGFHPRDSLVLVSVGGSTGRRVGLTVRTDVPSRSSPAADLAELCQLVVGALARDEPRGAFVLVVAPVPASGTAPDSAAGLPHRALVDAVSAALRGRAVAVLGALWAESTAAGARWACYDPCACRGALPDPAATALAAATVLDGRVVHRSRDAIERMLEPPDPAALRRRELLLLAPDAGVLDTAGQTPRELLATVDAAIADTADGDPVLDDARIVELARALATPTVRDAAALRCLGRAATAAERLWTALVREFPDPEAAEPAVLLAACALLRGDGGLANIALARAEAAWPGHRLTGLLRVIAEAGTRPAEVRRLLRESLVGVRALVDLPGPGPVRRAGGGSARTPRRRRPSC